MDHLGAMRSFRRVIERESFSRAAEELGLSSAGLGKQIRWLEERLGVVLIQRTTRRMGLTETGRAYYEECCRLLDELDEVEHSITAGAKQVSGRLRVNAPLSFGLTVLSPALPHFMARYPDLKIDLTLSDRLLDVVAAGFDISIRIRSELTDSSLIARKLGDVEQVICAAPAYLEKRGEPLALDDLHHHDCLAYTLADNPGAWHVNSPKGEASIAIPAKLSANNSIILRDMIVAGMGIGALPSFIAKPEIGRGALVPVLVDHAFPRRHVYAVYPTTRHLQSKVRVFLDFLTDTFEEQL
ncbi:LysR family transcriptional regulator [Microvirga sp. 2MCAF38]|uniref:LysR family transcriptional regulator n=1 Tax=Microvirga sp. 2MCAF38 TaxID=3232989 RepID=UPI003F9AA683